MEAKWVDRIKDGRFFINSINGQKETHSWEEVAKWLKGDELRVYLGTYGISSTRGRLHRQQVTLASCSPVRPQHGTERYGRAVFVGPREEAIEHAKWYWEMMCGNDKP